MNMKKTTHLPFIATAFLLCGLCIAGCKKTEVDNAGAAEAPAQPDTYMAAIDRYLIDSIASQYSQGDVCIPFTMLVDADASDSTDIKVWGTFWVDNYTIAGDTLKTVSGGSHPGLMHVAKTSDGYRVTSFDAVGDGASFDPTARQIFGDKFEEVEDEKTARRMALLNAQAEANETANANVTSTDLLRMMNTADNTKTLNVIVKGDVAGSVTSVVDSLRLIDTQGEITLNIVSTGVGAVSENDVYMASGGKTIIYGFNVTVPNAIAKMAERNGVPVRSYRVIYELLDDAKHEMEEMLDAEMIETETGELEVKGVFRTEKTEVIAGGMVKSGRVAPGMLGRAYRKKDLLGEVEVVNVQEGKVDVPSLAEGELGGMSLKTQKKIQLEIGDRIQFFVREYKKKKIA